MTIVRPLARKSTRVVARAIAVPILIVSLGLLAPQLRAAPKSDLWPRWQDHRPGSQIVVDHGEWQYFLDRYLDTNRSDNVARVRYGDVSSADRRRLDAYVDMLQNIRATRLNRDQQLAYWINLYNAYTVKVIIDHYPVRSIRSINISGIFRIGPWDAKLIEIEGEEITLNDIEHRILRPIWNDPRIHFALNCASIGCPNLAPVAYRGDNAEELLEQAAHEFIGHPRAVELVDGVATLSSIFNWYQQDFGADRNAAFAYLARYSEGALARALANHRGAVRYHYDWSLNDASSGVN